MSEYGTVQREMMKKSMEKPAGEWKPTNRVNRPVWGQLGAFLWLVAALVAAAGFWMAFSGAEQWIKRLVH